MRLLISLCVLGSALASAGCEVTSSADMKTSGIDAEITVTANDGSKSKVEAILLPGGDDDPFNRIELNGGDALFGEADGERKELTGGTLGVYNADFATAALDTEFVISLDRALDEDRDAPRSVGTLPSPFTLGPLPKTVFSRGEDLVVEWAPSGFSDPMSIEIDGNCIASGSGRLSIASDTGSFTIPANQLEPFDSTKMDTCQATLTIKRLRHGSADDALNQESSVTLTQVRTTSFSSTP
jgi:hypothetical protein